MALFAQYAMVAAQEALEDAEWKPTTEEDLEATVSCIARARTARLFTSSYAGCIHWFGYR